MAKTSLHAFIAKDNPNRGGLAEKQRLAQACSVFDGIQEPFILSLACKSVVY